MPGPGVMASTVAATRKAMKDMVFGAVLVAVQAVNTDGA
jgi:hypothetical protein